MTDAKPKDNFSFLKIEYLSDIAKIQVILRLDDATSYDLAANPLPKNLKGEALVYELKARGAVLNDGVDAAGTILPAVQYFDTQTGKRTVLGHYQNGNWQDPASGEAARQFFDAKTGQRTYVGHYQNGDLQDPASREAAYQSFNAQTGMLILAEHYTKGSWVKNLSSSELAALNKAKGFVPPPLPDDLKQYELPGAQMPQPH